MVFSLNSINWLVFIMESPLQGTTLSSIYNLDACQSSKAWSWWKGCGRVYQESSYLLLISAEGVGWRKVSIYSNMKHMGTLLYQS